MTRLMVVALAVAVSAASLADCLPWESMTPAQMACCAAIEHDCNAAGMDSSCCPAGTRDANQAPAVAVVKVHPGPLVASLPAAWVSPAGMPSSESAAVETFAREILKLPERPTYLLISTFRI